jgi:thiol-disulfide isomerase/thioredoxin
MSVRFRTLVGASFAGILCLSASTPAAAQVTVEQIFRYKPSQKDVDVETPTAADLEKCKVEPENSGATSAYVAYGPQGQILRRFADYDGDKDRQVDTWRYYKNGLEVYRDIDTNRDAKADEFRWLTTAGTRWGADTDKDGVIDQWKMISAEEVSREAIKAMAAGDVKAFTAVLINPADIKALGLSAEISQKLQPIIKDPTSQLSSALKGSSVIKRDTKWVRFDSSMLMPNVVPSESGASSNDLLVYENVMAIVDNGGKSGFVQIGEMVKVGDAWKLTSVPKPVDVEGGSIQITDGGLLFQQSLVGPSSPIGAEPSPEMRQIIEQLQKLDQSPQAKPEAPKTELAVYNAQRTQLLGKLAEVATTPDEREAWRKQQIDQIWAAVQLDTFPKGVETLTAIEAEIRKQPDGAALVPYAVYRRLWAEYHAQLQQADASQQVEVQAQWLASLEKFIEEFPDSEDSADAMLEIAMRQELSGKVTDAKGWYTRLADGHTQSRAGTVAIGALRRFNLKGQPLQLAGPLLGQPGTLDIAKLRGKVVIVQFWATWCRPCTEELPQIQELYKTYKSAGLEVVGVNVDTDGAPIQAYVDQHRLAWPSIHESGGLQSSIAVQYGVITLPTTFLVDKTGKVISSSTSVDDLKKQVPELLK